jgi:RNA polymerase sigma-70 factor (ECF subfamily)
MVQVPDASARRVRDLVESAYTDHRQMVFHLALRYAGGRRAWAEDVTQEVFASLVKAARAAEGVREPKAWLYRATTNRCLNQLRRERFLDLPGVRWIIAARRVTHDPESLGIAEETEKQMWRSLEALPPKIRVAFSMHYFDGLKQTEIAAILGHSRGYVSKLIKQGETRIRALAGEGEVDDA